MTGNNETRQVVQRALFALISLLTAGVVAFLGFEHSRVLHSIEQLQVEVDSMSRDASKMREEHVRYTVNLESVIVRLGIIERQLHRYKEAD